MKKNGFSFAEFLIVMMIILIIAAIAIPNLAKHKRIPPPPEPPKRFQLIWTETQGRDDYYTVHIYRDTITDQEVVCWVGRNEPSCYLTGQKIGR